MDDTNRPMRKPRSESRQRAAVVATRLLADEDAQVRAYAADRGVSVSELLRTAVLQQVRQASRA